MPAQYRTLTDPLTPSLSREETLPQSAEDKPLLSLQIVQNRSELEAFARDWNQLREHGKGTPFQSYAWLTGWYERFTKEYDEMLVFVFQQGLRTRVIVPMYRQGSVLRLAGDTVSDQQDVIAENPTMALAGLEAVIGWAKEHRLHLRLNHLPQHSWISEASSRLDAFRCRAFFFQRFEVSCRAGDLPGSLADFLERQPRKVRANLRRHLNKLEREFPEADLVMRRAGVISPSLVDDVAEFHLRHFRKDGVSLFADNRFRQLIHEAAKDENSGLRIAMLKDGTKMMAVYVGFTYGGTFNGYLTAFDETYKEVSPGICLFLKMMSWLIRMDSVKSLDFLLGQERYKAQFTDRMYAVNSLWIYPWGARNLGRWLARSVTYRAKLAARALLRMAGLDRRIAQAKEE